MRSSVVLFVVIWAIVISGCVGRAPPTPEEELAEQTEPMPAPTEAPTKQFDGSYGGYFGYLDASDPDLIGTGEMTISGNAVMGEVITVSGKQIRFQGTITPTGELSLTADPSSCRIDKPYGTTGRFQESLSIQSAAYETGPLSGTGFKLALRCDDDYSELVVLRGLTPKQLELSEVGIEFLSWKTFCEATECLAGVSASVVGFRILEGAVNDYDSKPLGQALMDEYGLPLGWPWEDGNTSLQTAVSTPARDLGFGAFAGEQKAESLMMISVSKATGEMSAHFIGKGSAECGKDYAGLPHGGFYVAGDIGGTSAIELLLTNNNGVDRFVDVDITVSAKGTVSNAKWVLGIRVDATGETQLKIAEETFPFSTGTSGQYSGKGTVRLRARPGITEYLFVRQFKPFVGVDFDQNRPCPSNAEVEAKLKISASQVPLPTGKPASAETPTTTPAPLSQQANDIRNFQPTFADDNELHFTVDYTYGGEHGDNVYLGAMPLREGQAPEWYWYTPAKVNLGEGTETVWVGFDCDKLTGPITTDQVQVEMHVGGQYPFYSKTFSYSKTWCAQALTP